MKIYKYSLVNNLAIDLPTGFKILHFDTDPDDNLCLWAEVDPKQPKLTVPFRIVGTGQDVPTGFQYRGTTKNGPFVWHLYL